MISANNMRWLAYVFPRLATYIESTRPAAAAIEMGQRDFYDFEEANDANVEFTASVSTFGYQWEGQRRQCLKSWQEALELALMEVRAEEYQKPEVAALRKQGWKLRMFGPDGAAYLENSDGRAEPIYHSADAAWAAKVRSAAL